MVVVVGLRTLLTLAPLYMFFQTATMLLSV